MKIASLDAEQHILSARALESTRPVQGTISIQNFLLNLENEVFCKILFNTRIFVETHLWRCFSRLVASKVPSKHSNSKVSDLAEASGSFSLSTFSSSAMALETSKIVAFLQFPFFLHTWYDGAQIHSSHQCNELPIRRPSLHTLLPPIWWLLWVLGLHKVHIRSYTVF